MNYKYIKDAGTFNKWPSPIKETTQDEFLNATCHRHIYDIEQRQITGGPSLLHATVYYLDDRAYAIVQQNKDLNTNRYSYFRIGCSHEHMTSQKTGNCLTKYTCPDCGYVTELDSSD